jgi:restriction endonuclease Mrr
LKFVIEAKRYGKQRRVGIGVVQRLLGVKDHERASKAVLVTTTYFSKDAQKFAREHEYELDLKDYDALLRWSRTYAERHQPPRKHQDELTAGTRRAAPERGTRSPTGQSTARKRTTRRSSTE